MKKIQFLISLTIFTGVMFYSCSHSPKQKAIELIEAGADDYIEKPKYTFNYELEEFIDKDINDVIGYELIYEMETGGHKFKMKARFNKNITTITDNSLIE